MFISMTGLPGSGKTLYAIKYVLETESLQNRPVYYFGLSLNKKLDWTALTEEQVLKWYELPQGSVIIIDEAQKLWRQRKAGDLIPESIQQLETHRSRGYDIIITCQAPMQLDVAARRLVGKQFHFQRKYAMQGGRLLTFERMVTDPDTQKFEADISTYKLDKKYFGYYESTILDTHHSKKPLRFYIFTFIIFFGILFIAFILNRVINKTSIDNDSVFIDSSLPKPLFTSDNLVQNIQQTAPTYLSKFVPRINAMPFSASLYDQQVQAQTMPKISGCMVITINQSTKCSCNSQQGTHINLTQKLCLNYYENGWFDFTQPDIEESQSQAQTQTADSNQQIFNPENILETITNEY